MVNENDENNEKVFNPEIVDFNSTEGFEDVLELTNYTDSDLSKNDEIFIVAEYEKIDIVGVTTNQTKVAKKFIQEAKKLIKRYANNGEIGAELNSYLESVGNLQLTQLADLLTLVVANKSMLDNMIHRINSVQADDYALIQTYTTLLQQHIKLHRELSNTYSSIPAIMKKMATDIDEQLMVEGTPEKPVLSEEYGEKQFNSSKELLKKLRGESTKSDESK